MRKGFCISLLHKDQEKEGHVVWMLHLISRMQVFLWLNRQEGTLHKNACCQKSLCIQCNFSHARRLSWPLVSVSVLDSATTCGLNGRRKLWISLTFVTNAHVFLSLSSLREQLLWRRRKRKVIWMPQMMWARFKWQHLDLPSSVSLLSCHLAV